MCARGDRVMESYRSLPHVDSEQARAAILKTASELQRTLRRRIASRIAERGWRLRGVVDRVRRNFFLANFDGT